MSMSRKDVFFTLGIALLMGVIWGLGELVTGMWIGASQKFHIFWFAGIVLATLIISVWHSMKEDESDRTDPKKAKYDRKTKRYSKK